MEAVKDAATTLSEHVNNCEQCYTQSYCQTGAQLFGRVDDDTDALLETLAYRVLAGVAAPVR